MRPFSLDRQSSLMVVNIALAKYLEEGKDVGHVAYAIGFSTAGSWNLPNYFCTKHSGLVPYTGRFSPEQALDQDVNAEACLIGCTWNFDR